MWIASDESKETITDAPRPEKWRAPTWSWAATTVPVTYANLGHWIVDTARFCNDLTESIFFAVTSVQCVPETDDPTMRLKPDPHG